MKNLSPAEIRRLAAEMEAKIVKKEIEFLDEWIVLITDIFSKARKGGATTSGLIAAFEDVLKRMETRKKTCYRDASEIRKKW